MDDNDAPTNDEKVASFPTKEDSTVTTNSNNDNNNVEWLELQDPGDGSRLVSGCPVCFLTTTVNAATNKRHGTGTGTSSSSSSTIGNVTPSPPPTTTTQPPKYNVMVISWLMPVSTSSSDETGPSFGNGTTRPGGAAGGNQRKPNYMVQGGYRR